VAVQQPHIRDVLFIQKRAASGLSGFAPNHIPYYRQEQINARSGVNTPRSTLAVWSGQTGAQLMPLYEAHRAFVLCSSIEHADETPISMLDPGAGKTRKAYIWAYARGAFDPEPGVVFDFCLGRGGKYPTEFLKGWSGTLVVDSYEARTTCSRSKGAAPPIALLTRGGNSTSSSRLTPAQWPRRRSSASPGCTGLRLTPGH
jgi:hypothetical protein